MYFLLAGLIIGVLLCVYTRWKEGYLSSEDALWGIGFFLIGGIIASVVATGVAIVINPTTYEKSDVQEMSSFPNHPDTFGKFFCDNTFRFKYYIGEKERIISGCKVTVIEHGGECIPHIVTYDNKEVWDWLFLDFVFGREKYEVNVPENAVSYEFICVLEKDE